MESLAIRGQPDPLEQLDHRERGVPGESLGRKDDEANKDCRVRPELLEIMEILDSLDPLASLDLLAHLETLYVEGFGVIVLHTEYAVIYLITYICDTGKSWNSWSARSSWFAW